jgi:hypothetical protein
LLKRLCLAGSWRLSDNKLADGMEEGQSRVRVFYSVEKVDLIPDLAVAHGGEVPDRGRYRRGELAFFFTFGMGCSPFMIARISAKS